MTSLLRFDEIGFALRLYPAYLASHFVVDNVLGFRGVP